jgi:hypothetical protein
MGIVYRPGILVVTRISKRKYQANAGLHRMQSFRGNASDAF